MRLFFNSDPRPELRPYVRAYAQRVVDADDPAVIECVPAQLDQVLNFELGKLPGVRHRECSFSGASTWIGGAQTSFSGFMDLSPGVESFAIFFQPAGWSQLFNVPVLEITNRIADARAAIGSDTQILWNRIGDVSTFEQRVHIVEGWLGERAALVRTQNRMAVAATFIFRQHGAVRIPALAEWNSLGVRQFERRFEREIGTAPKTFARVARFQAAIDAKLADQQRTWLNIAHRFGYFDQMHMIHDFEKLGHSTPSELLAQMGDVRPPGLGR